MTEELYEVVIRCLDDEEYEEVITKEPVSYRKAVAIDRGIEINLSEEYYTDIIKATQ